jgi:hypothetical protein
MKKYLIIGTIGFIIILFLFFYLGIELELKNTVERFGIELKTNQLVDTSFKIRNFLFIQLILFILISLAFIYFLFRKK